MLYFSRNGLLGYPEAIFTGRFIFISPSRYSIEDFSTESSIIREIGISAYLSCIPKTDVQKTVFEEVLHSKINQMSTGYLNLSWMRYIARWRWIIFGDHQYARKYYIARCLYFAVMNPYQERLVDALEQSTGFDLRNIDLDQVRDQVSILDSLYFSMIDKYDISISAKKSSQAQPGWMKKSLARPPSIFVLQQPPSPPNEYNLVLGSGDFPSDWEMGYFGGWRNILSARAPLKVIANRFRSPELYRRNTYVDDLKWMRLKFATEREMWPDIIEFIKQNGSTISLNFDDYYAGLVTFAADWASVENYESLLELYVLGKTEIIPDEIPLRVQKAINFFYLHEN